MGPVGPAPSCSATRTQHREVRAGVRRPGLLGVAQVALRGGTLPRLEMGERGGQAQPGIGRGGLGTDTGQRAPQRPVVPGQDQPDGEAVQQVDQQRSVAAVRGVLEGGYRLVLIGPPAGGHGVQLGHPSQALALQVGEQIGAQQFLDAVGLARAARSR